MPTNLPPMNSLRLFEAAGRLSSFKLAAEELNVSASAVSHGIQTLERWLGTELFERGPRGLALTEAGKAYLPYVAKALARVAAGANQIYGRKPTGSLSITAAPSFASRWLLPQLSDFHARFPDVALTIDTARQTLFLPAEGIDLAIRAIAGQAPKPPAVALMREALVPVCAPALFGGLDIEDPAELLRSGPLIHVTSIEEGWTAWADRRAVVLDDPSAGLNVDTIDMAIEAAVQGLGIAIGRTPLVDAELESGRLVPIMGPPVAGDRTYWMVPSEASIDKPEVKVFRRWLLSRLERNDLA